MDYHNMSVFTSQTKEAGNNHHARPSTELTDQQARNAKKLLRMMSKGRIPAPSLPDVGPVLASIFPDLIEAMKEDGIRGFCNACRAIGKDYPLIPQLLKESAYKLLSITDLLNLPDQDWLIEEILYEDSIAVLYGLPGCNKSFIGVDWSCCLALGWEWKGRKTKRARIIYVAAEGARGYRRRILAWAHENNLDPMRLLNSILFLPREVPLSNEAEVNDFAEEVNLTIEEIEEATGEKLPVVIVLDTIFQCASGLNINATEVMTTLTGMIKHIKRETNAIHVLAVHHSGKDKERGMSGNIALKANVDMAYYVESDQDGITKLTTDKAKDDEGIELYLQRRQVIYGDGPRDNSCVMDSAVKPSKDDTENEKHQAMLSVLPSDTTKGYKEWQNAIDAAYPGFTDASGRYRAYIPKPSFDRYLRELKQLGVIENLGSDRDSKYRKCLPGN